MGDWQAGSLIGLHGGHDLLFADPVDFQYGTHTPKAGVSKPTWGGVGVIRVLAIQTMSGEAR